MSEDSRLAKEIFPEGCKRYLSDGELSLDGGFRLELTMNEIRRASGREMGKRYEHVCYSCGEKCEARKVERGDAKNRYRYLPPEHPIII